MKGVNAFSRKKQLFFTSFLQSLLLLFLFWSFSRLFFDAFLSILTFSHNIKLLSLLFALFCHSGNSYYKFIEKSLAIYQKSNLLLAFFDKTMDEILLNEAYPYFLCFKSAVVGSFYQLLSYFGVNANISNILFYFDNANLLILNFTLFNK